MVIDWNYIDSHKLLLCWAFSSTTRKSPILKFKVIIVTWQIRSLTLSNLPWWQERCERNGAIRSGAFAQPLFKLDLKTWPKYSCHGRQARCELNLAAVLSIRRSRYSHRPDKRRATINLYVTIKRIDVKLTMWTMFLTKCSIFWWLNHVSTTTIKPDMRRQSPIKM